MLENPTLSEYTGFVQDSGEGRWTIQAAWKKRFPPSVLTASLYTRFRSRQEHTFAEKMAFRHAAKVWRSHRAGQALGFCLRNLTTERECGGNRNTSG